MTRRLVKGDHIRIRLADSGDEWVRGRVIIASESNPSSVGLMVEGMVRTLEGGWIGGGLPLFVDYQEETVVSLLGDRYEIEVAE